MYALSAARAPQVAGLLTHVTNLDDSLLHEWHRHVDTCPHNAATHRPQPNDGNTKITAASLE